VFLIVLHTVSAEDGGALVHGPGPTTRLHKALSARRAGLALCRPRPADKPGQSGADADITAVLLMKDGSALRSSTVVGGTRAVPMSHVTFAGGMQEQKFVQYLGNANSASVGLIGRFLPLWPPATNKDLDHAAAVWKEHSGAAVGTPLPVSVLQVACPYLLL
jgi:hypothetical protein